MPGLVKLLLVCLLCVGGSMTHASESQRQAVEDDVEQLQKPLYSPFIERYVLDELKQLRVDLGAQKSDLLQQITDRQLATTDRTVTYATDTITYFFYLIAAATSILVVVGWTSIRDIKDRVQVLADEEISRLVSEYEKRLAAIEQQLSQKTRFIEQNRDDIALTQEVQSLWLRAAQEASPASKIAIYDQILKLRSDDYEALTYKADAVLELGEPQWAANLCHQALAIDGDNGHALYQLACAYTAMNQFQEAVHYLSLVLSRAETYWDTLEQDLAFAPLQSYAPFQKLLKQRHAS